MSNKPFYILNEASLTIFLDGKPSTVSKDHHNWDAIVIALKDERYDDLHDLMDESHTLDTYIDGDKRVEINHGYITYNGMSVDNTLTRRIMRMRDEGFEIDPMLKFLTNLMENPSNRAINELYTFLDQGDLPITEDGYFLAYKLVSDDYKDCHSRSIDNSIGQIVKMPRGAVDDDSDRTCSHGLHACSLGYLRSFYGKHLMAVKIHPKDVVSIPKDYNNSKLRCCAYEVVAELDKELINGDTNAWDKSVVTADM